MPTEFEPALHNTAGPAGVGADLRAARLRLGWTLPEISAWLRIRLRHLEALEEGRVADLPGTVYAIGYLRTYAHALGLDPDGLARRFRLESAELPAKPALAFPSPVPERSAPVGAVVLVGLVLAIGCYVGWYRLSGEGRLPAEVVPPVPARLAPLAEQAIPPAAAPKPVAPSPAPVVAAPPPPASSPTRAANLGTGLDVGASDSTANLPGAAGAMAPPSATASVQPTSPLTGTDTTQQAAASAISPTSAAAATSPATPASGAPASTSPASRITLGATADDWVQVRDKVSGQVLLNRLMHAGDTWAVPAKPSLVLTVGNAGGTDILVDGNLAPSIGNLGAVRRDIPLDPDLLRDGKATVATTPAAAHTSAQAPTLKPAAQ